MRYSVNGKFANVPQVNLVNTKDNMKNIKPQTSSAQIEQHFGQVGWNVKDSTQIFEEFDILTLFVESIA